MSKKIEDAAEGFVVRNLATLFACAISFDIHNLHHLILLMNVCGVGAW